MSKKELLKRIEALEMRCDCLIRQGAQDKRRLDRLTECYHKLENDANAIIDEWEDYEEQKGYWYIRDDGSGIGFSPLNGSTVARRRAAIGNYFETKEEAEKAVEKLKAFRMLQDKGFRFESVEGYNALCGNGFNIPITETMPPAAYADDTVSKDLDICFGGEE